MYFFRRQSLVLPLIGLAFGIAQAQTEPGTTFQDAPEPPPLPERVQSGEIMEPDVTIVHGSKETVYEYRVNGELRAIKVVPDQGPPYYLVDADGDGRLETQQHALAPDFLVNSWVLFSW